MAIYKNNTQAMYRLGHYYQFYKRDYHKMERL